MRRLLAPLLFGLALRASAEPGRAYVTEFGRRILVQTDQIVEARVQKLLPPFRGIRTARLEVAERLSGYDREETLSLLYVEDYVAPDAFNATLESGAVKYERARRAGLDKYLADLARLKVPKAEERNTGAREVRTNRQEADGPARGKPGVRLAEGEEALFFLRRQSTSYALVGLLPRSDPLYETKRARLRDVLRVEAIGPLDERARNAQRLFLDALATDDPWLRANSARELGALAARYPRLFGAADAQRLADRLAKETEPSIRASLERAAVAVDPDLAVRYARAAEESGRERHAESLEAERKRLAATELPELRAADLMRVARAYGRGATQLLAGFLADPAPLVREYAAHALAEQGGPSAVAPLRAALERETDADAAMALIYALGIHADPEAVPLLMRRLADPALERAAIHAIARVGTGAARAALETHARRANGETKDLIANLLKEEFAERP